MVNSAMAYIPQQLSTSRYTSQIASSAVSRSSTDGGAVAVGSGDGADVGDGGAVGCGGGGTVARGGAVVAVAWRSGVGASVGEGWTSAPSTSAVGVAKPVRGVALGTTRLRSPARLSSPPAKAMTATTARIPARPQPPTIAPFAHQERAQKLRHSPAMRQPFRCAQWYYVRGSGSATRQLFRGRPARERRRRCSPPCSSRCRSAPPSGRRWCCPGS